MSARTHEPRVAGTLASRYDARLRCVEYFLNGVRIYRLSDEAAAQMDAAELRAFEAKIVQLTLDRAARVRS